MQTPNILFGKIYHIQSHAFDAETRAKALVEEKRQQGIDAAFYIDPLATRQEGSRGDGHISSSVFTNEGDQALDTFRRWEDAKVQAKQTLHEEFPAFNKPSAERTDQDHAQISENLPRIFHLLLDGGDEGKSILDELAQLAENGRKEMLFFNRDGQPISKAEYDTEE